MKIWIVWSLNMDGRREGISAVADNLKAATDITGQLCGYGTVEELATVSSSVDWRTAIDERKRRAALAKLDDEERRLLGLQR